MTTATTPKTFGDLLWDPSNPEHIQDPYPAYEVLRTQAPLWRHPFAWVLSRSVDIEVAIKDRGLLNHGLEGQILISRLTEEIVPPLGDITSRHQRPWVLFQSGDHHSLMRRLLNRGFSASSLERIRPEVHRVVDELTARVVDEPTFDFMEQFALALPITMISELFDVPEELRASLKDLLGPLGLTMAAVPVTAPVMQQVDEAVATFEEAMSVLIAERRANPGDDMISLLVGDKAEGVMSDRDVLSNLGVLLFAGYETTVGLLGNGMLALMRNPEQRELLTNDPGLIDNAVEEMLRYDAPAQRVARVVHEPIEFHGQVLERGDLLWLMLGSGNRDPDVYVEPEKFDVQRRDPKPLSFGRGPHFCIGAPLARMEAQIVFPAILPVIARYELASEVSYNPSATLRAPTELILSR